MSTVAGLIVHPASGHLLWLGAILTLVIAVVVLIAGTLLVFRKRKETPK